MNEKEIKQTQADYRLFIDIQLEKHLKGTDREEFKNSEEFNIILPLIIEAWNNEIADNHERLDNSSKKEKISWFNSIDITVTKTEAEEENNSPEDISNILYPNFDKTPKEDNSIFPFLQDDSYSIILLAHDALSEIGFSSLRFIELVKGEKPSELEIEILTWAHDIALILFKSFVEKSKTKSDILFNEAIELLEIMVDTNTAQSLAEKIIERISKEIEVQLPSPPKSKSPKGKGKRRK